MPTLDLSALTNAFVGGGEIFGKEVLNWDIRDAGIQVRTNVKTPQALAKYSADGKPRPYRKDDDFNGGTFTDRVLTVRMSKYDLEIDSEDLRNEYLAELPQAQSGGVLSFEAFAVQQASKQYLAALITDTLGSGLYNAGGNTAADISDGWLTIIAAAIIAGDTVEVATGAITSANAVTKAELLHDSCPTIMKKAGMRILCSHAIAEYYAIHYRTLNGFGFDPKAMGSFKLDNRKAVLQPVDWLDGSQRMIATVDNNLIFGTDKDTLAMHATPHLNILQARIMMAVGTQVRDFDVMRVNDQA